MHPSPPVRWLIGAYVAVALSFVGTTLFTQHILRKIDRAAVAIMENASPSIERLAAIRSEIREVEGELDSELDLLDGTVADTGEFGRLSAEASDLPAARRKLDDDVAAYRKLPRFVGEDAMSLVLFREHATFDHALDGLAAHVAAGDLLRARNEQRARIHPAADSLAESTLRLIELNAEQGHALAGAALAWRRQAEVAAIALDAACLVVAAVALLLSVSAFRRHTEVLVAHAALQKARGDELEAFAARVAHDITSPLSGAKLGLDAAVRRVKQGGDPTAFLDRGLRSLTQTTQIVDGLYEFARAGASPDPNAATEIDAVVRAAVDDARPLAEARQIEIVVEPLPCGRAACAPGVLASLVSNLVHNAVKYMGEAAERRVVVRAAVVGSRVRFEVEDTGPGLPHDLVPTVFDAYVRAPGSSQHGLGLGLATVKRLAERHGGAVGVRSAPARGAVFWFELPTRDDAG